MRYSVVHRPSNSGIPVGATAVARSGTTARTHRYYLVSEHLREFLVDRGFQVGLIDPTLFTKKVGGNLFICQIYVDDIIFGSTNKLFNEEFCKLMSDRFDMSMMREFEYFLGFEIKQYQEATFIKQAKYTQACSRGSICMKPSL